MSHRGRRVRKPWNSLPLPHRGQTHANPARIDPESESAGFSVMNAFSSGPRATAPPEPGVEHPAFIPRPRKAAEADGQAPAVGSASDPVRYLNARYSM